MTGKIVYPDGSEPRYFLDGAEVTADAFAAAFPPVSDPGPGIGHLPACWPMDSESLAVHPSQVSAANERARLHGIAAEYLPDGTCRLASREARRRLLRLEGLRDNQGGYGD